MDVTKKNADQRLSLDFLNTVSANTRVAIINAINIICDECVVAQTKKQKNDRIIKLPFDEPFTKNPQLPMDLYLAKNALKLINHTLQWEPDVLLDVWCIERTTETYSWEQVVQRLKNLAQAIDNKYDTEHNNTVSKHFIELRGEHMFCMDKQIDFPNENALYVVFVKALLKLADENGFASYEAIDYYISQHTGEKLDSLPEKKKRMSNACENLYRKRQNQKNPFPKVTPKGSPVIRIKDGSGYVFNNSYDS
ncbi:MAG: hypothetical protein WC052_03720 [Patescibacteria group bacterium]